MIPDNIDMLKLSLAHKAAINAINKYGDTDLMYCVGFSCPDVAFLLSRGADTSIQNKV